MTNASCVEGRWSVRTGACGDHYCASGSSNCSSSQLCFELAGGALLVECRDNPCGESAIEEDCACSLCPEGAVCSVYDQTVSCNTCPSGLCP